jgi:hypothetical protein
MKGQAFDTFKLLIAAVIAVAILGILLSIIGGISLPYAEPQVLISQQLKTAVQYPHAVQPSSSVANFKTSQSFGEATFSDAIGGVGKITFVCADTLVTTGTSPCQLKKSVSTKSYYDSVKINSDFSAKVSACCTPTGPSCTVKIGEDTTDFSC